MKIEQVLQRLDEAEIYPFVEEGKLKTRSKSHSMLSSELVHLIKSNKDELLRFLSVSSQGVANIKPQRREEGALLSYAQNRLWFITQLDPNSDQYNISAALRFRGQLDIARLEKAIDTVVQRHEILRTCYIQRDGEALQKPINNSKFVLERSQKSALHLSFREIKSEIQKFVASPFDLTSDLMIRGLIIPSDNNEHILAISMHHIAADGGSIGILLKEVEILYRNGMDERVFMLLSIQYPDFAMWQHTKEYKNKLNKQKQYWLSQLSDVPQKHNLPLDYPRQIHRSVSADAWQQRWSAQLTSSLKTLAKAESVSLFVLLNTLFNILLSRASREQDAVVGTPVSGRNNHQIEPLVGCFVNTLVLRNHVDGERSFREQLDFNNKVILDAFEYQDYPLEQLVDDLSIERSTSYTPLFQILFSYLDFDQDKFDLPEVEISRFETGHRAAKCDLELTLQADGEELLLDWLYADTLFDKQTIINLGEAFKYLAYSAVANPNNKVAHLQLVEYPNTYNGPNIEVSDEESIIASFMHAALTNPNKIAVQTRTSQISYTELDEQVNTLAARLSYKGVQHGDTIAVCLPRNIELVVTLLAIQKCGGSYIPLDPVHSANRIDYIVNDAQPRVLIHDNTTWELLAEVDCRLLNIEELSEQNCDWQPSLPQASDLLYTLYTSGTTGNPKGVLIEHRCLLSFLKWARSQYSDEELALVLGASSLNFDISALELYLPLMTGNTLLLVDNILALADDPFLQPTLINSVPSLLQVLLETEKVPRSVKTINSSGEVLTQNLANRLLEHTSASRVMNQYGPTETNVCSYLDIREPLSEEPTIGVPVANTTLMILGPDGKGVQDGMIGELFVGGVSVARGYHGLTELSAKRFVECGDTRFYATGDLARFTSQGTVSLLGRADQQIKLRGFRIEISDIEANLKRIKGINNCAVLLKDTTQSKFLVAYVELQNNMELQVQDIKTQLSKRLPDYMIPEQVLVISKIPLNSNGKVDFQTLKTSQNEASEVAVELPKTAMEKALAVLWTSLLEISIEHIDRHSNFFSLGGNSLLVVKLVYEVEQQIGKKLTVKDVFDNQRLSALAALMEEQSQSVIFEAIEPRPLDIDMPVPLSTAQQRIWMVDHLSGGRAYYNIFSSVTIDGRFDVNFAKEAMRTILERHHILRTCYIVVDGEPRQVIQRCTREVLTYVDIQSQPSQLMPLLEQQANVQFDLTKDLPIKVAVIQTDTNQHILSFNVHHIAADGATIPVLVSEFFSCYQQLRDVGYTELPALSLQYADFAWWQSTNFNKQVQKSQLAYWSQQLADMPQLHQLPLSYSRPDQQDFSAGQQVVRLPSAQKAQLEQLARTYQCSLFMVLHALFVVTLARYAANKDIVVGTASANRRRAELKSMVGCFVNTLILRNQYDGEMSFIELLQQVRSINIDAQDNQDIPFEQLVEMMQPERSASYSPLVQIFFNMDNNKQAELADQDFHVIENEQEILKSKFDLSLTASADDTGILLRFVYASSLLSDDFVAQFAQSYQHLAQEISLKPDQPLAQLSILNEDQLKNILDDFNQTDIEYNQTPSLIAQLEEAVAKTPEKVAFFHNDEGITYGELNAKANALANELRQAGVYAQDVIPVMVKTAFDVPLYFLAIWKASAIVAPLDVDWPQDRLREVIASLEPKVVLTNLEELADSLSDVNELWFRQCATIETSEHRPPLQWRLDAPVYIFHTSGSTGKPKGAVNVQRGLLNRFAFTQKAYNIMADDVFMASSNTCFDPVFLQTMLPMLSNAQAVLPQTEERFDIPRLLSLSAKHHVNFITFTPTLFNHLVDYLESGDDKVAQIASVREITVGGERINANDIRRYRALGLNTNITNWYGPTETTIGIIRKPIDLERLDVIGRPIANVRTYVLDENHQPVPIGVPGELYVAGDCLGEGYWRAPEQTAEAFLHLNICGRSEQVYRTGDLVVYLNDGDIRYIGRTDDQIKIRGLRVELDEVIARLRECPEVDGATVLVEGEGHNMTLVGYVVLSEVDNNDKDAVAFKLTSLRNRLASILPAYMLPSSYAILDSLPMGLNHKIDKNQLKLKPLFEFESGAVLDSGFAKASIGIWQQLLGLDSVDCESSFFSLGGNSLLCIKLRGMLAEQGYEFSLQQLMAFPSIMEQQSLLEYNQSQLALPAVRLNQCQGERALFMIHPMGGGVQEPYQAFADQLSEEYPVIGLQAPFWVKNFAFDNWAALSDYYIEAILTEQKHGPFLIGAYSGGGRIAVGLVNRLLELGHEVEACLFFDTYAYFGDQQHSRNITAYSFIEAVTDREVGLADLPTDKLDNLDDTEFYHYLADWLKANIRINEAFVGNLAEGLAFNTRLRQLPAPTVEGYTGQVHCWFSSQQTDPCLLAASWKDVFSCTVDEHWLDASHLSFLNHENLINIKPQLLKYLSRGVP